MGFSVHTCSSTHLFIAVKVSSHQRSSKDKPRSLKYLHFCLPLDNHSFCPSCRESSKGDDPCVTFEAPCEICSGFTEEQMLKIKNRKRYVRKQKADTSKDDELDLLGDEVVESFTGSQADLEGAADYLFASPHPQPLHFELLSLTALQQKIESKLEKPLGSQINIQLQQQMGIYQTSMLEAMKSLRDEFQSFKTMPKEVEVDQTSTSASKPDTSKQTENLDPTPPPRTQPSSHPDEAIQVHLFHSVSEMITLCMNLPRDISRINIQVSPRNLLRWSRLDPKNMQIKESTRLGPGTYLSHHLQRKISPLCPYKGLPSPLGPLLIKTNLNTIQTHFFIGK